MKKVIIILALIISSTTKIYSQESQVYIGTQFPLFYSVGFEQELNRKFSISGQFGYLTSPYDKMIISFLKSFDDNDLLYNTIGEAFQYGLNYQPTFKWKFGKNYIGVNYSYVVLTGEDTGLDIIENYFGIPILFSGNNTVNVKSNLHNAGILYGRKIYLNYPEFIIKLELSVQKTFTSKNKIKTSSGLELDRLNSALDSELNEFYTQYAFLPSINIYLVYTF